MSIFSVHVTTNTVSHKPYSGEETLRIQCLSEDVWTYMHMSLWFKLMFDRDLLKHFNMQPYIITCVIKFQLRKTQKWNTNARCVAMLKDKPFSQPWLHITNMIISKLQLLNWTHSVVDLLWCLYQPGCVAWLANKIPAAMQKCDICSTKSPIINNLLDLRLQVWKVSAWLAQGWSLPFFHA